MRDCVVLFPRSVVLFNLQEVKQRHRQAYLSKLLMLMLHG